MFKLKLIEFYFIIIITLFPSDSLGESEPYKKIVKLFYYTTHQPISQHEAMRECLRRNLTLPLIHDHSDARELRNALPAEIDTFWLGHIYRPNIGWTDGGDSRNEFINNILQNYVSQENDSFGGRTNGNYNYDQHSDNYNHRQNEYYNDHENDYKSRDGYFKNDRMNQYQVVNYDSLYPSAAVSDRTKCLIFRMRSEHFFGPLPTFCGPSCAGKWRVCVGKRKEQPTSLPWLIILIVFIVLLLILLIPLFIWRRLIIKKIFKRKKQQDEEGNNEELYDENEKNTIEPLVPIRPENGHAIDLNITEEEPVERIIKIYTQTDEGTQEIKKVRFDPREHGIRYVFPSHSNTITSV